MSDTPETASPTEDIDDGPVSWRLLLTGAATIALVSVALLAISLNARVLACSHVSLPPGTSAETRIAFLEPSAMPDVTTGVFLAPDPEALPQQRLSQPRPEPWGERSRMTWQAGGERGVQIAMDSIGVDSTSTGWATVQVRALPDTPSGAYRVRFKAAYEGYHDQEAVLYTARFACRGCLSSSVAEELVIEVR